jgi:predicted unusual protein kinase regulating ubiquinone biosynthesis (AarF/ABC1/UbiB family)
MFEEVDYCNERLNLEHFRELFEDDPRVLIPEPVEEYTTRHLLTMELLEGESADDLCAPGVPQERRDRIGETLVDLVMVQAFRFRALHADPNLANYAFTSDDRVIIYDFGCVKRFTAPFMAAYRRLVLDALERRFERTAQNLAAIGFADKDGKQIDPAIFEAYADVLLEPWDATAPYNFGSSTIHQRLIELGLKHWRVFTGFTLPADVVFFDRVIGGMYGNLRRLNATGRWGAMLRRHLGT